MYAKHEPESWSTSRNAPFVPGDDLMGEGLQNAKNELGTAGYGHMENWLSLAQAWSDMGWYGQPCVTE